jgi:hypothetical protein
MSELLGTHMPAPDLYVVPPTSSDASRITTDLPSSCARIAVEKPAMPLPTTTTSNSSASVDANPVGRGPGSAKTPLIHQYS